MGSHQRRRRVRRLPEAARLLAENTAYLLDQTTEDHDFLEGARRGFTALSEPTVDVENLRMGLVDVVRQVCSRPPSAAASGADA